MDWNNEILAQNLRFRRVEIIKSNSNEKTEDIDKLPKCAWCECITHEEEVYLKWGAYEPKLVLLKKRKLERKKKPSFVIPVAKISMEMEKNTRVNETI